MYILECMPKETADYGIVNLGYVKEHKRTEQKPEIGSLTVSLRINKPEFIFLIKTAANKKRYFITKCEILSDYSCHNNGLNFIVSLSNLHTLFCDCSPNSTEPYLVLKPCDVELSKTASIEKGKKATLSISSIYVQISNRVVHSIEDILNDIAEHFRVPDSGNLKANRMSNVMAAEIDDLWEPKKLEDFVSRYEDDFLENADESNAQVHEILLVPKLEAILIFEIHEIHMLLFKSTVEITVYDWSSLLNCTCELTIQANYYNENVQAWEPLIDPVTVDESEYKPWEILVKVFQDKALPIIQHSDKRTKREEGVFVKRDQSSTSTDSDDSGGEMTYLEPANPQHNRIKQRIKTSLSAFLDDSDSENDDSTMEKLANAISDLFTGQHAQTIKHIRH